MQITNGSLNKQLNHPRLYEWFRIALDCPMVRVEGLNWYSDAHLWIQGVSKQLCYPVEYVAAIVAALSPKTSWETNKLQTLQYLCYGTATGLKANVKRADKLHELRDVGEYRMLAVFGKRAVKITNFYHNLMGREHYVTVDTWMYRAAGIENYGNDAPSRRAYNTISEDIRSIAAEYGYEPCQVQALIWCAIRSGLSIYHQ